ncbi:hypothetical protein MBLNU459_g5288t1 [Dothideomycetes sp. NU459]
MPKRARDEEERPGSTTPKRARHVAHEVAQSDAAETPSKQRTAADTPSRDTPSRDTPSKQRSILKTGYSHINGGDTPKSLRKVLFSTPARPVEDEGEGTVQDSPLTAGRNADLSAKRKSRKMLIERDDVAELGDEDDGAEDEALAMAILDSEAGSDDEPDVDAIAVAPDTPSKTRRGRGRPKGKRRVRTPTPPQDLPPHELYFFHNRPGGMKTSTNTLPSDALLNHDDYFAHINDYNDPHEPDKAFLADLHRHSFDQWFAELGQGFNICLYGYGSKRSLLMDFAHHLHESAPKAPKLVVVNGFSPTLSLRDVLVTVANQVLPSSEASKLPLQPSALLDALLIALTVNPPKSKLYLVAHSIDAPPMRKPVIQSALSRLAAHPSFSLIASADTPNFPLLWDISQRSAFRYLFHDTTTFEPYTAEIDPVEEVNALLGRSGRRVGGKDGVAYVLRSLPENARSLFRILVAEQIALADTDPAAFMPATGNDDDEDGLIGFEDHEDAMNVDPATPSKRGRGRPPKRKAPTHVTAPRQAGMLGVEYRTLYHKAVEEFVCSSEMSFRTLLKEFHDHAIIESRKDAAGTERLAVPFGRNELEEMLEELV